jgi:hypothetical protein
MSSIGPNAIPLHAAAITSRRNAARGRSGERPAAEPLVALRDVWQGRHFGQLQIPIAQGQVEPVGYYLEAAEYRQAVLG